MLSVPPQPSFLPLLGPLVGFAGGSAIRRPLDIQERSCLARRWRGAAVPGLKGARLWQRLGSQSD